MDGFRFPLAIVVLIEIVRCSRKYFDAPNSIEGGFQTRPYKFGIFFAPFALFAAKSLHPFGCGFATLRSVQTV